MSNNRLLEHFGVIRRYLNLVATRELKSFAIGPKQMVILRVLERCGVLSLGALAKATTSDPAAISRAMVPLTRSGLIEKSRDKADKRQWLVQLTRAGKRKVPHLHRIWDRMESEMVQNLSPIEAAQLSELFEKITRGFKSRYAHIMEEETP